MYKNFKCFKTQSILKSNEKVEYCKSIKPLKIILLTTSKHRKYIVSFKPKKTKTQDNISLNSETQTNVSKESSFYGKKFMFDTKSVPWMALLDKIKQTSATSLSSLEARKYNHKLKHTAANILRLTGGWGQHKFFSSKKKHRSKEKPKTAYKIEQNINGNTEETFEASSAVKSSTEAEKPLGNNSKHQIKKELNANQDTKSNSLSNNEYKNNNQNQKSAIILPECTTTLFVGNLLKQKYPHSSSKDDFNTEIQNSGGSAAFRSQHKQAEAHLRKGLVHSFPCDGEMHKRIDNLEQQVSKMNIELQNLRAVALPSNDTENFCGLSKHLSEVNILLKELRKNISELQNIEFQMKKGGKSDDNEEALETSPQNYFRNSIHFPGENHQHKFLSPQKYLATCNCQIYKNHQHLFTQSKYTDAAENWSCNCINYLPSYQEDIYDNESDIAKPSLAHYSTTLENHTLPQMYKNIENASPTTNQLLPNQSVQGAENNQHYFSFELPSSPQTTVDNQPVTTAAEDSAENFADADSSGAETISSSHGELPLTTHNIRKTLWKIIGDFKSDEIALTICAESNNRYLINVSLLRTGQLLGYIYTTEAAFKEAKNKKLFERFLIFSVLNSKSSSDDQNEMLNKSFEFLNMEKPN